MLLLFIFYIYSFRVASGIEGVFDPLTEEKFDENDAVLQQSSRLRPGSVSKKNDYDIRTPTCDQMARTSFSPFVCVLLKKTSGRFIGMGSIIDKYTVISAAKVVEASYQSPYDLLALGARLGPWWGKHSQVKQAREIYTNDAGLALVKLQQPFVFDKNVSPIRLPSKVIKDDASEKLYGLNYAIFGIPRSSWDMPGDYAPKSTTYNTKIETQVQKKEEVDACKAEFPDLHYNETINFCTTANGTFCWGCIGSPTVAVTENDKVLQIATITKTTLTENDVYHVHTKIAPFDMWIRSQSNINYKERDFS